MLCHMSRCDLYKIREVIAETMAYMVMIVKAVENYTGLAWVWYDEAFHNWAAAKRNVQWFKVNPSLFAQCFTAGKAHNPAYHDLCWSSSHPTQDCALRITPNSDTTASLQSMEASRWSWQSPTICGGLNVHCRGNPKGSARLGMGAAALITHASTEMPVLTSWDLIQHVDALSRVILKVGVAMLSEVTCTECWYSRTQVLWLQCDLTIYSVWNLVIMDSMLVDWVISS